MFPCASRTPNDGSRAAPLSALSAELPVNAPFFFSGPTKTLVAHDEGLAIEGRLRECDALVDRAEATLRALPSTTARLLVGALPFADDLPVRLFCPRTATHRGRWWVDRSSVCAARPSAAVPACSDSEATADGAQFLSAVQAAVEAIARGDLRKVVLSRVKEFRLQQPFDVQGLLRVLRARNPHGFIFALSLPPDSRALLSKAPDAVADGPAGARTLVGASPELLLSRRGNLVVSAPLAGSVPRSTDSFEDQLRAERLRHSPKDLHEHRLVVDQILESLRPFMRDLRWEHEPTVIATPSLWHLSTRIEGALRTTDTSSLRLALALHPTPAVCGVPTRCASEWIRRAEPFDRGYFTGTLGFMDCSGDGDWVVTIRCAELLASRVRVFAGAGIVESSKAEAELAETDAKMQTMLEALGVGARA